jgi:glutathione S-transferase
MSGGDRLKIWGRKNSINVMKVLWCCEELGLPFDRIDVGGQFGGTKEASYLAKNPNARVPTIEDKGLILWESNVIVRYLASTYGRPGLCPDDPALRWQGEQWMDWQQTTLHPEATPLFWGLIRTPPDQRDPVKLEAARQGCAACWTIVDDHLRSHPFMAGADFSMADIPLGAAVFRWFAFDIERPPLPRLEAWYKRLCEREGYRTHIMQPMT